MSANNYTKCPQCARQSTEKAEEVKAILTAAYGKVPPDEYLALVKENSKPAPLKESLREDWEIGIYKGEFFVSYRASCDVCGFTYEYEVKQDV